MTQGVKTPDQVASSEWIQALLFQQITAAQFVQIANLKLKRKRKGRQLRMVMKIRRMYPSNVIVTLQVQIVLHLG